ATNGVATYDVPNSGSCTVNYQVCAPAPNQSTCDTATLTVTAQSADMRATVSGLPAVLGPGQQVDDVTLTCRNAATGSAATQPTCVPAVDVGTLGPVTCTPSSVASLVPGGEIVCRFRYTAPGQPGGEGVVQARVNLTGQTSASNDGNPANDRDQAQARVVDAVDDGRITVPASGASIELWSNDRVGGASVSAESLRGRLIDAGGLMGASLDASGRVRVPVGSGAGVYALRYEICSADLAAACDQAAVTIVVEGEPDLTVAKTHSPAVFTEGSRGSYRIVVSNRGDAATSAAYTVVDRLPAGMTVASLPVGSGWDCSATQVGSGLARCSRTQPVPAAQGGVPGQAEPITLSVQVATGACRRPDADGVCTVASGAALVNQVEVSGGGEPDRPSHRDNNGGEDPTPVQQAGAVSGRVWFDENHNRVFDAGDRLLEGVVVEVLDASGTLVATGRSGADGSYRVEGLHPGSGYSVRFRDAVNGAYYGQPISADPAGGNDPNADPVTGVVPGAVIQGISVPPGGRSRVNQNLPLDPAGVVYAADTRQPVAGARVELRAGGELVPAHCVVGGVNAVTTTVGSGGIDGGYALFLNVPVPAGCPGNTEYELRVTPPAGYVLSRDLPVQPNALRIPADCSNGAAAGVCTVQAQNGPPTGDQPTTWFLRMPLDPVRGPGVVNNHIPLDAAVRPALFLSKTADRSRVELGDSLRYTITVKRSDSGVGLLDHVEVIDTLPAGLRYIDGTAQLDGRPLADPAGRPGPVLRFTLLQQRMAPGTQLQLSYRVRVGVGAQQGSGINRAQATNRPGGGCNGAAGEICSNPGQHRVQVDGGVFAADACVVGKVYSDCNHNHRQDAEEPGIPGVRLYLQDGTHFVTDVEGKYSHCGLAPRTHVLVVDGTTLPRGSRLVTSSSRNAGDAGSLFLDLKAGELHRADVIEGSCSNTVLEQVKARRARGDTGVLDTEKQGGRVLKFDGKRVNAPQQATDSADQRGDAAGQGEPGAVKPRRDGGQAPPPDPGRSTTGQTLHTPVSQTPTSSGATQPPAPRP
ncbi:MAG: hypothetical protein L6Q75_19900, partial [Burkholderiaceae bacterium]|nr:hypothetical protein [Burkholderiaceae bacterium]